LTSTEAAAAAATTSLVVLAYRTVFQDLQTGPGSDRQGLVSSWVWPITGLSVRPHHSDHRRVRLSKLANRLAAVDRGERGDPGPMQAWESLPGRTYARRVGLHEA